MMGVQGVYPLIMEAGSAHLRYGQVLPIFKIHSDFYMNTVQLS